MGFEIERKFLVRGGEWQQIATKYTEIRQAYLSVGGKSSVRVRISDNRTATLTVKSRPAELRRLELEYPIPTLEAEALIVLRQGSIVEKVRYLLPVPSGTW
jgi:adenylate cyclase